MTASDKEATLVLAAGVARSFGTGERLFEAVQPASFRITAGQHIALVGRSGSGKSTLMQMIAGIDAPSTGKMDWPSLGSGQDLRPGHVSVMFQSPSLIGSLNVLENVGLPLALLGQRKTRDTVAMAALARFGVEALCTKLPEELSGGQAQRVALARAIVTDPGLLLADEPTGQLDHGTGEALISHLIEWAIEAKAALLVATHDPEIAATMNISWQMDHGVLTT